MHIVILGNGVSGITTARFIRKKSDCNITVVSDESDQFFSRTALMYVFMGHMRLRDIQPYESWFWKKNNIRLVRDRAEGFDFFSKKILLASGQALDYDKLVIATGSAYRLPEVQGLELDGVQGMYHLSDLENMERHAAYLNTLSPHDPMRRAVVVGGGLIGVEMAEMWHARGMPVTFLVREKSYWNSVLPPGESAMVSRHLQKHHIDLRLETTLDTIVPDVQNQRCAAVKTNTGEVIPCGFTGLSIGVAPNVDFLRGGALELAQGVLVDEYLQTNLPDVYAIGDCAELRHPAPGRRAVEAMWYTGRAMGETLADTLTGNPGVYEQGIWFNSAKFFDIEYQVYGYAPPGPEKEVATLYWQHPRENKSIRLCYMEKDGRILGFVLMGVRYRHEVCAQWIKQGAHVETVLQNLGLANFDPEFCPQHEAELVALYNQKTGASLRLQKHRGLGAVLHFLRQTGKT